MVRRIVSVILVIALACSNLFTGVSSAASLEKKERFIIKYTGNQEIRDALTEKRLVNESELILDQKTSYLSTSQIEKSSKITAIGNTEKDAVTTTQISALMLDQDITEWGH